MDSACCASTPLYDCAPAPLEDLRYGYLCVSDLLSQAWCEQQMVYSFRPPPDVVIVEREEKPQVIAGSHIHLARGT